MKKTCLIICGPTASGKSNMALNLAEQVNGAIINADSMQVYYGLPLLTASPAQHDKTRALHYLYNFLNPAEACSVASYLDNAKEALEICAASGKVPIITGGTGMYISALIEGVAKIPEIDRKYRDELIEIVADKGILYLYEELTKLDPSIAAKLKPGDTQRIIRAYEVIKYTGQSLLDYHKTSMEPLLADYEVKTFYLKPERSFLYKRCDERFLAILENGGLKEVEEFLTTYPNLQTSLSKALGVSELEAYLAGACTLEEAIKAAQTRTRRYAKRQLTWFNHRITWPYEIIAHSER